MSSILVIVRCTGRLIGSRPWRLLVVLAVGPIAGCAAPDSSRTIERTYSTPAQVAANDPVAPQSAESKSTGPAAGFREKPNPAPPSSLLGPDSRSQRKHGFGHPGCGTARARDPNGQPR